MVGVVEGDEPVAVTLMVVLRSEDIALVILDIECDAMLVLSRIHLSAGNE